MKSLKIVLLACIGMFLVACSNQDSYDWLEGDWKSTEWQVTYEIDEEDGKWSISEEDVVLLANAKMTKDDEGYLNLKGDDGTQYIIEKVSEKEINLQMVAADGLMGATNVTSFQKIKD